MFMAKAMIMTIKRMTKATKKRRMMKATITPKATITTIKRTTKAMIKRRKTKATITPKAMIMREQ